MLISGLKGLTDIVKKLSNLVTTVIVPALVILAVEVWTESCTCVVKHGGHIALIQELNLRIYTISWCQEWDTMTYILFQRQTSNEISQRRLYRHSTLR